MTSRLAVPDRNPNPPSPRYYGGENLGTSFDGCCPHCGEELVWNQDWPAEHVDAPKRLSHLEPGDDGDATQVVSFWDRCPNCCAVLHVAARITVTFDIHGSAPERESAPHLYD